LHDKCSSFIGNVQKYQGINIIINLLALYVRLVNIVNSNNAILCILAKKNMKVFTTSQIREIDASTIANEPVASIDLMERAAGAFAARFVKYFNPSHAVKVFAGPGNNGGDALAIARMLSEKKYQVRVYLINLSSKLSEDCNINLARLKSLSPDIVTDIITKTTLPELTEKDVVIDGIFGSGLSRPAEDLAAQIIHHINDSDAQVISIDIPSGLYGEDNRFNKPENILQADRTLTFQFPFLSFFFADNEQYTGLWEVLDIGLHQDTIRNMKSPCISLDITDIQSILKPRNKFSHKGTYGHALLISGSYGMMGAAVLGAKSCLRGGAGLVTVHVPKCGYSIIQTSVPEALTSIDESELIFTGISDISGYSAIGTGPGLGCDAGTINGMKRLLENVSVPLVIDADGLNILSEHKEWYNMLPENTILTPHPGEFDRLTGKSASMYERYLKQLEFSATYNVIIALKGAHTIITSPEGNTWFNTTGNPGMATGGSGDVLTGLIVSLLSQGYTPLESTIAGVYIHGLAGDLAKTDIGEESLTASDLIDYTGKAFLKVNLRDSNYNKFVKLK